MFKLHIYSERFIYLFIHTLSWDKFQLIILITRAFSINIYMHFSLSPILTPGKKETEVYTRELCFMVILN